MRTICWGLWRPSSSCWTNHPLVLREPEEPVVRVKEQADSAMVLLARFWCANADYWNLQFDLLQQVKLTFDEKGISIPFPQMDVHVKS